MLIDQFGLQAEKTGKGIIDEAAGLKAEFTEALGAVAVAIMLIGWWLYRRATGRSTSSRKRTRCTGSSCRPAMEISSDILSGVEILPPARLWLFSKTTMEVGVR